MTADERRKMEEAMSRTLAARLHANGAPVRAFVAALTESLTPIVDALARGLARIQNWLLRDVR